MIVSGQFGSALEEAAEWYFRQDCRDLSETERARFEAWLSVPGNRAAYEEIGGVWHETGALASQRSARRDWSTLKTVAKIAASLVLVLGVAGYVFDVSTRLSADVYTEAGERRSVTLPDGSVADVNTASALATAFTANERKVRLFKGEAVFTVAEDSTRPFVIEAGGDRATALGTEFAVRRTGEGTIVTVLASEVAVTFADGGTPIHLGPGEQIRAFSGGHEVTAVDAEATTAWRHGRLVFSDKPLSDVVAEINRYHAGMIRVVDASLSDLRVSGVFDATDPVGVVDALEDSLGIFSTRLGSAVVLLHR